MATAASFARSNQPALSAAHREAVLLRIGRALFASGLFGFGAEYLLQAVHAKGPLPGPPLNPARTVIAWICAAAFMAIAVSLFTSARRWAADICALLLSFSIAAVYLPRVFAEPRNPGPWTSGAELSMMCAAAILLASPAWPRALVRLLLAAPLVIIGTQHFIYAGFVATLVPAYIPFHLFWTYLVGVAFFAVALSILTRYQTALAGTMLGIMLALFVVLLHAERVAAAPVNGAEWTSLLVALMLSGGALVASAKLGDGAVPAIAG